MKILYAIQGTGNGHLSRARAIIPLLKARAEVDLLVSGTEAEVSIPYDIRYRFKGLSFVFGKKGGIDLLGTFKKSNLKRLRKEIKSLPVEQYDLVINDFEPVSAWACKTKHVPCLALSHQFAVLDEAAPEPDKKDIVGRMLLKNYAPVQNGFGFHFKAYAPNIFTPVIRPEIRNATPKNGDHYVVYLPAYSDKRTIAILREIPDTKWYVFSKKATGAYKEGNVYVYPIDNDIFVEALINCSGVLCGAGFETPAEALFLKKKLMVIPMKGQYEQQCNAAALKQMGVPVLKKLEDKYIEKILSWTVFSVPPFVDYADETEAVIDELLAQVNNVARQLYSPLDKTTTLQEAAPELAIKTSEN